MPDEPMSPTRPEPPLGRLTRFKWLMGVLLLLALLIGWWTGSFWTVGRQRDGANG